MRHRTMPGATALAFLIIISLTACRREAPPPASTAARPAAPAAAPSSGVRLYVSDETGGNVIVIDPDAGLVVERIAVGKRPRGLRISRDGTQLLVALSGNPIAGPGVDETKLPPADRAADGIGVVDLATHKLVRTVQSGPDPESFDLSPDGKMLYVSNEDAAQVSVVDMAAGIIQQRVDVAEEPEGVTMRPGGREVYVTCEATNEVCAIDTATAKVAARMKSGARPRSVVFTADGAIAFVTDENSGTVTVIDAPAHKVVATIKVPPTPGTPMEPRPMGAVLSPDGRKLYVSLGRAKSVAVVDVAGRTVDRSIEGVGTRPWGIGVSADGRKLYTANGPSGDVSVIDVATGKVDKQIATGGSPWGVAVK
jgi:YVTN family beta-propeller protein